MENSQMLRAMALESTGEQELASMKSIAQETEAGSTTEPDDSPKEPEKIQTDEETKTDNEKAQTCETDKEETVAVIVTKQASEINNASSTLAGESGDNKVSSSDDQLSVASADSCTFKNNYVSESHSTSTNANTTNGNDMSKSQNLTAEELGGGDTNCAITSGETNSIGDASSSASSDTGPKCEAPKCVDVGLPLVATSKVEPERIIILPAEESTIILPSDNVEKHVCYCGKERNLNTVELQCAGCYKWFHKSCISVSIVKCIPFITNYTFICRNCNTSGSESFVKRQSNFSQICLTSIANLMQQSIAEGNPKALFSKDREIIPFVDKNWESLTTMQRRVKQTWHTTIHKTMLKESDIFIYEETATAEEGQENEMLFGLSTQDLFKIGPCYENQLKTGFNKASDSISLTGVGFGKGRSAKRKFPGDNQVSSANKKPKSDLTMPKLPPHGYPLEHPFNKDGYRYILAEPDPHAPFRQEFDESSDWAGKPIPGWLFRTLVPNTVLLAMHDRAPQLKVSEERLSTVGEKGYCMIRATHGISRGTWYFECNMDDMPEGTATRIGWSQPLGNLQAPLGYDKFSYSWRSRKGTKFHQSRGQHYSNGGYGQGDVIGVLIELPFDPNEPLPLPQTYKDKPLVKFKSYLYFEEKDEVQKANKMLKQLPGSKITFFKNGENMGVAYRDIFAGTYYPAISLYKSCTVTLNCGPKFRFVPRNIKFRGIHEAAHAALIEQTAADLTYFAENEGKLRLDL